MVTQERLKELLHYDPETGVFRWRVSIRGQAGAGAVAGTLRDNGYIIICIDRRLYRAHRLAFLYMGVSLPPQVDHENHIRNDNRWVNLSPATSFINQRNCTLREDNQSGVTGIHWNTYFEKWTASIAFNKKRYHLGRFKNKEDAIKVRKEAEKRFGFHPNHGASL